MNLTYNEKEEVLESKNGAERKSFSSLREINELREIYSTLKSLLTEKMIFYKRYYKGKCYDYT